MSEWPIHICTVRRSTPARSCIVQNVALNLCRNQCSHTFNLPLHPAQWPQFSLARLATAFRQSRKSSLGLHPAVGNTSPHVFSACTFQALSFSIKSAGIGISLSL